MLLILIFYLCLKRGVIMIKLLLIPFFFIMANLGFSQEDQACYRVSLIDKTGTQYSIDHPEEFLSPEALARRARFNIPIDESDLPVSRLYLDSLKEAGFRLVHSSKWNNTVTVASTNGDALDELLSFPFVKSAQLTRPLLLTKSTANKFEKIIPGETSAGIEDNDYGNGWEQIHQLNGEVLHEKGFKGAGIRIAVLDAGFDQVDTLSAFQSLREENRLLGTRDFVNPGGNVFEENDHGTGVLSILASDLPGQFVGTAPEASYWLIRSEDAATEYPVEEDNWVAALEFADSIGADVVNSSLGYFVFDEPSMDHPFSDLDGQNTLITRAANLAVQKGIFMVNSAGNEGNKPWGKIILPADGEKILAVGAVGETGERALFSSLGPNASGSIKPNLMARGETIWLMKSDGKPATSNGTSFAAPLITGIVACLQQAFPSKTPEELKTMLEQSGNQYSNPDTLKGYGIPNIDLLFPSNREIFTSEEIQVHPTFFHNHLNIASNKPVIKVSLFNIHGNLLLEKKGREIETGLSGLENLPGGVYILEIKLKNRTLRKKLLKENKIR